MTVYPIETTRPSGLAVDFCGEIYRPTTELVFGRDADLVLDDNSFLHRRAGRFQLRGETWWLQNLGSRLRLTLVSSDGSVLDLRPGSANPLLGRAGAVSLHAGPVRYQMDYQLHLEPPGVDDGGRLRQQGADTMTFGPMLTPRELDFVVVLARGRLTGRLGPLPSHGEIAEIWGVSAKTVDNTLQRLRTKLRKSEINFVQSTETLVEYLVTQGLVTMSDLEWAGLEDPAGPRPSASRAD